MPAPTKSAVAEQAAVAAESYAAWLRTPAGRKHADQPIARMLSAFMELQQGLTSTAEQRAVLTTAATATLKDAGEEVKRLRSNSVFDLRAEGVIWDRVCELIKTNRARADQILKGVSGGAYQEQKYRELKR